MKFILLTDWSDYQAKMPVRPSITGNVSLKVQYNYFDYKEIVEHILEGAGQRNERMMKAFYFWRKKQPKPEQYQLVLWHTHFPHRFIPPLKYKHVSFPFDCSANLFSKMSEAIAESRSETEPLFLADDSFDFRSFDIQPFFKQMESSGGIVCANNAWMLSPAAQALFGKSGCESENSPMWMEQDFADWTRRAEWQNSDPNGMYKNIPHAYTYPPKSTLEDLYAATMFILRHGYIKMFPNDSGKPFMSYDVNAGGQLCRYWSCGSYDLINRVEI